MKVTLLANTPNPEKIVAAAARLCYSNKEVSEIMNNFTDEKIEKFINKLISLGHESPLEHVTFTFGIEGISRACYDEETEILTNNGWKYFKDIDRTNDKVLTRNQNGEAEFQKPIDYIEYDYKGEMHIYKSQNINLKITPNHNLLLKKYDVRIPADFQLTPSKDFKVNRSYMTKVVNYNKLVSNIIEIKGYEYLRKNRNQMQYKKNSGDLVFNRKDFYKLLAWYIAEGSTYYNKEENSYTISICQLKEHNILTILEICKNLNLKAYYDGQSIRFKNLTLGKYLSNLGNSKEKFIPLDIENDFNKELAKIFIDEYIKGDGTIDKNGCGKIYTISPRLFDQLYTLSFIAGYSATYHVDDRVGQSHIYNDRTIVHNHQCYIINLSMSGKRNREIVIKKDKHFKKEMYEGKVYCVEVPNHIIFVRRRGIAIWCGNCSHQLVRHRIASYSQKSQRYVKENDFDYVIPPEIENSVYKSEYERMMHTIQIFYNDLRAMGFEPEDARMVLPNACCTSIVITMNVRSLLNFFKHRDCKRAQWEIRALAQEMMKICKEVAPRLFAHAGASCRSGKCSEGSMSCGEPYN